MKRVNDLFPDLLRKQPQKQLPVEEIVRGAWAHIAGRQIASRSLVFRVFDGTLIVHVPDQTWRRQLNRFEGRIVANVNHFLGRSVIRGVDFRVDPAMPAVIPAKPARSAPEASRQADLASASPGTQMEMFSEAAPPRKGPARELTPAVEAELAQAARAIADPELRELFLRASRRMVR